MILLISIQQISVQHIVCLLVLLTNRVMEVILSKWCVEMKDPFMLDIMLQGTELTISSDNPNLTNGE